MMEDEKQTAKELHLKTTCTSHESITTALSTWVVENKIAFVFFRSGIVFKMAFKICLTIHLTPSKCKPRSIFCISPKYTSRQ